MWARVHLRTGGIVEHCRRSIRRFCSDVPHKSGVRDGTKEHSLNISGSRHTFGKGSSDWFSCVCLLTCVDGVMVLIIGPIRCIVLQCVCVRVGKRHMALGVAEVSAAMLGSARASSELHIRIRKRDAHARARVAQVYGALGTGTAGAALRRPSSSAIHAAKMRRRLSTTVAKTRPSDIPGNRLVRLERKTPGEPLGFVLKTVKIAQVCGGQCHTLWVADDAKRDGVR